MSDVKKEHAGVKAPPTNLLLNSKIELAFIAKDDLLGETMLTHMQKKGFTSSIYYDFESVENHYAPFPDAVIVDMDHFDFAQLSAFQEKFAHKEFKVFVVSANSAMDMRLKALQVNAQAFISKPVNLEALTDELSQSFGLKRKPSRNVLIVDDDPLILKLCQRFLEAERIRVRLIENPMDILHALEEQKPDLIILDYYMPEANGIDIKKVIRQIYDTSEIPVLFMTGTKDENLLDKIHAESEKAPIMKPFHKPSFIAQINEAMS